MKKPWWQISLRGQDDLEYLIPSKVIHDTEKILLEYASKRPSCEGIVYWAGVRNQNKIKVFLVVAPDAVSAPGHVSVSAQANFHFVKVLSDRDYIQVGQVHTHPSKRVDHSGWDDDKAAFKVQGLLSIVVPSYCKNGMIPLIKCGVHRFEKNRFQKLSNWYVKSHFELRPDLNSDLEDLRKWHLL